MKKLIFALALAVTAAGCGDAGEKGPTQEEMKTAASKLLQVPEAKITEFKKGECRSKEKGYVCTFEMYIAFGETPTRQALDKGYFFQSGGGDEEDEEKEWVMELVG